MVLRDLISKPGRMKVLSLILARLCNTVTNFASIRCKQRSCHSSFNRRDGDSEQMVRPALHYNALLIKGEAFTPDEYRVTCTRRILDSLPPMALQCRHARTHLAKIPLNRLKTI